MKAAHLKKLEHVVDRMNTLCSEFKTADQVIKLIQGACALTSDKYRLEQISFSDPIMSAMGFTHVISWTDGYARSNRRFVKVVGIDGGFNVYFRESSLRDPEIVYIPGHNDHNEVKLKEGFKDLLEMACTLRQGINFPFTRGVEP